MFKLKALLVASLFVVAANTHAMQPEQQGQMDIVDNVYEPLPLEEQRARVAAREQFNAQRGQDIKAAMPHVTTSAQADVLRKMADHSCQSKLVHELNIRAEQLHRREQGLLPNAAATNLFPTSDSDSE